MALGLDLSELARHLKQERLFVSSERDQLQGLYEQVKTVAEQLYHASWIAREQKSILDALIRSSKEVTPAECCSKTNQLESSSFVDGYKYLSYHDSKYGEFFKFLHSNPQLIGQLVSAAEHVQQGSIQLMVKVVMHSIFGNCILQEDEMLVLQLLKCLLELQLATNDNPRRMLRRGSSSFSVAFKHFFDTVFSAKLFLTAALHDPVMRLLMEDEWFYDIDPNKALVRFPLKERVRRFGEPGTEDYKKKLAKYRVTIVDKLVTMASRFINSIKNNMHCFPPSLGWLVSKVYHILTKTGKMSMSEVRAICADLVFALFICPAICDPEPHGITTDVPISHIARHNLMQIAQIVQVLAISQLDDIDHKVQDLYSRFDKGCMSSLLDSLLDGLGPELPLTASTQLPCLGRTSVLINMSQLNTLVTFLRSSVALVDHCPEKKCLEEVLMGLPPVTPVTPTPGSLTVLISNTPTHTPPGTPQSSKKSGKKKSIIPDDGSGSGTPPDTEAQFTNQIEDVLVISLGVENECPGMIAEQKILTSEQESRRRRVASSTDSHEKRTRFSLSHDQESIGNTSDIPEAISEGASSHSVASQDLENDDNDNFSDMISANVSGRGTPNISGRDTPLSQAESVEQENNPHPQPPALPETVQKTNREDVTDRFGKFDIKNIGGEFECDDFKSTVSDTWSIDVLASDSEPPEQNQHVRLEEIAEEMVRQNLLGTQERVAEISETASDAWSTDVLASDTDEKQIETLSEFDQDDMSSATEFSNNMDDVQSEVDAAEGTEITPLASGVQSPSDNNDMRSSLNQTRPNQGRQLGKKIDFGRSSPPLSDNVFADMEEDFGLGIGARPVGRPVIQAQSGLIDNNKLFVPIKSKKHAPNPPNFLQDKSGPRLSSDSTHSRSSLPDVLGNNQGQSAFQGMENVSLATGGSVVIAPESGARPKVPKLVNLSSSDRDMRKRKEISILQMKENHSSNGDILRPSPMRRSADSGVGSAQFTVDSMTEASGDVKLLEQQNTNLDETRFSNALNLFDPLSSDGQSSGDLLEGIGSPTLTPFQDVFPTSNTAHSNRTTSCVDVLLTRTNGGTSTAAMMPKSQFDFPNNLGSLTSSVAGGTTKALQEGENSDMFYEAGVPGDTANKRRGSGDSSHSSGSSMSKDDSVSGYKSERTSLDNTSQNLDEKFQDLVTLEDGSTSGKKKSLFKNLRDKINKGIKTKTGKHRKDMSVDSMLGTSPDTKMSGRVAEPNIVITETSDDILEKYRSPNQKSILTSTPAPEKERHLTFEDDADSAPLYDPQNLETCVAFLDAKRKLRMVLGSGDFQIGDNSLCFSLGATSYSPRELDRLQQENNELVNLLRAQLSEAINLQNKDTIAQLHEALRCVRMFDADGCKKLVRSLQEDYQSRSSYISYLVRSKQGLLTTLSHLKRLLNRINREKEISDKHMINVCVRLFLEARERNVAAFIADFQKLTVSDEKTDHVERFLEFLYQNMHRDQIWLAANETQIEDAHLAIERYLMSRIYTHAMFPNGDGDILRDQLIQQHIYKLIGVITPNHKAIRIPRMYHLECPWPAAQREIYMINAYKTPKDKLQCVQRCSTTIMNLLSMANTKSVPAADDFMPVLIYVIIKANPPCLLSTVQYVNSFYQNRLQGEEQYWWMQFCAAIEFIKTME